MCLAQVSLLNLNEIIGMKPMPNHHEAYFDYNLRTSEQDTFTGADEKK